MVDTPRAAGRLAAAAFVTVGLLKLLSSLLPWVGDEPPMLPAVAAGAIALGLVAWLVPWHRLPRHAPVVLAPAALTLIAVAALIDGIGPFSFSAYFLVVFIWVGATQPPGTTIILIPLATVAYLVPVFFMPGWRDGLPASVVVLPVCLILGEAVSRSLAGVRRSRTLDVRRLGDLEALVASVALLQSEMETERVGDLIARLASAVLHGTGAEVLVRDARGGLVSTGLHGSASRLAPGDPSVAEAMDGGRVVVPGPQTLVIPLVGTKGTHGVVAVRVPNGAKDRFAGHVAQLFGSQAGLTMERLHVIDSLADAVRRDPLTGLGNRRHASLLLESLRPRDALLLIDLDHFKDVNDRFGHTVGDEVLVRLAHYLRESLRNADAVARYGGEEFLVVLRGAGAGALAAADRLLDGWREIGARTSFSGGLAVHDGGPPSATLARADRALYEAKRSGRDRVNAAQEPASEAV